MAQIQWAEWAMWWMVGLALLLLVVHDWRGLIAGLAALQAALLAVLWQAWPAALAVTQLIAGWLAGAMLAIGQNLHPAPPGLTPPWSERLVRLLAGLLAVALVWATASTLAAVWPQVPWSARLGGASVALLGLIQAAWSRHPLRLSVGLLTGLSGFLALYAWQHHGLLLTGLLGMFQVLLAWAGSYLIHQTLAGEERL